jgi:hypothetical protein
MGSALLIKRTLEWKLRMKADFHHKMLCSGMSKMDPLNLLTYFIIILSHHHLSKKGRNFISALQINNLKNKKKKNFNQTRLALASTLFVFSGSAWSYKTGKRMMKKSSFFFFFFFLKKKTPSGGPNSPRFQVQVQKTSPQVNSNQRKKERKVQQKVEQIFRTRA